MEKKGGKKRERNRGKEEENTQIFINFPSSMKAKISVFPISFFINLLLKEKASSE